ncbi:U-box domain-containing protein 7, partial [Zea mays]
MLQCCYNWNYLVCVTVSHRVVSDTYTVLPFYVVSCDACL